MSYEIITYKEGTDTEPAVFRLKADKICVDFTVSLAKAGKKFNGRKLERDHYIIAIDLPDPNYTTLLLNELATTNQFIRKMGNESLNPPINHHRQKHTLTLAAPLLPGMTKAMISAAVNYDPEKFKDIDEEYGPDDTKRKLGFAEHKPLIAAIQEEILRQGIEPQVEGGRAQY